MASFNRFGIITAQKKYSQELYTDQTISSSDKNISITERHTVVENTRVKPLSLSLYLLMTLYMFVYIYIYIYNDNGC